MLLQLPEQHWACVNCSQTDVTRGQTNRFHACPGLKGLTTPMVLDGFRGRVFAVEREAYVGREIVTCDGEGRPVSAVVTERWDGSNDVMVNAPCARIAAGV